MEDRSNDEPVVEELYIVEVTAENPGTGAAGTAGYNAGSGSSSGARVGADASADDPDAIRAEIRETRDRVGDTLEQIGERLNPHHITEQVKENLRDATIGRVENMAEDAAERVSETRDTIIDTIRDNPIPAAMVGIGLGWLLMNGRKSDSSGNGGSYGNRSRNSSRYADARYTDWQARNPGYASGLYQGGNTGYGRDAYGNSYQGGSASGAVGAAEGAAEGAIDHLRDRAGELGQTVKYKAGDLAHSAQDMAGSIVDRTQGMASSLADHTQDLASSIAQQGRYQTRRVEDLFQEAPLVAGVATMALGLATGLALPSTRTESQLMGDARDHFVDRARQVADETKTKVGHVAEHVVDQAGTAAAEAAKSEGLTT